MLAGATQRVEVDPAAQAGRVVVTGESNAAKHNGSTRVLAERRNAVWCG